MLDFGFQNKLMKNPLELGGFLAEQMAAGLAINLPKGTAVFIQHTKGDIALVRLKGYPGVFFTISHALRLKR